MYGISKQLWLSATMDLIQRSRFHLFLLLVMQFIVTGAIMYVYTLILAIQVSIELSIFKYHDFILNTAKKKVAVTLQYVSCCDSTRTA
jgi:hypothetical protein